MTANVGFVAIARETFDIPLAQSTAETAFAALARSHSLDVVGSARLATDAQEAVASVKSLDRGIEAVVVFQATFADSSIISAVAKQTELPLVLWATPEPRTGGRLRLNSFCGINLAAYVLARRDVDFRWVYRSPDDDRSPGEVVRAIAEPAERSSADKGLTSNRASPVDLTGKRIGLVGTRPDGFEPCDFDTDTLSSVFGVSVDTIRLEDWFEGANSVPDGRMGHVRDELDATVSGLAGIDQESLARSIQLYLGLSDLADARGWNGVATRCWPECFTEFGGAACAGNSMLTSSGMPGCCEADVYGNLTALLLQETAGAPALIADLIDLDTGDNTAVFWHCGLAPREMAAVTPRATVHSNRRKPLLFEFPLRAGRITIARVSQARNSLSLVVGGGEMLDAPLPFSGTSGVAVLDRAVPEVLDTIMGAGLEHHYGIVYGDHQEALRAYARHLGLQVIEV